MYVAGRLILIPIDIRRAVLIVLILILNTTTSSTSTTNTNIAWMGLSRNTMISMTPDGARAWSRFLHKTAVQLPALGHIQ